MQTPKTANGGGNTEISSRWRSLIIRAYEDPRVGNFDEEKLAEMFGTSRKGVWQWRLNKGRDLSAPPRASSKIVVAQALAKCLCPVPADPVLAQDWLNRYLEGRINLDQYWSFSDPAFSNFDWVERLDEKALEQLGAKLEQVQKKAIQKKIPSSGRKRIYTTISGSRSMNVRDLLKRILETHLRVSGESQESLKRRVDICAPIAERITRTDINIGRITFDAIWNKTYNAEAAIHTHGIEAIAALFGSALTGRLRQAALDGYTLDFGVTPENLGITEEMKVDTGFLRADGTDWLTDDVVRVLDGTATEEEMQAWLDLPCGDREDSGSLNKCHR